MWKKKNYSQKPKIGKQMYSPRISKLLVPKLYKISQAKKIPMTKLVDFFIKEGLKREKQKERRRRRNYG